MNPLTADRFAEFYRAVYGYEPFPWQVRLTKQVCGGGEWPRAIALPTAAGKTTCLDIAVFALACLGAGKAPRRIFFVVDRRIVVDQAQLHALNLTCQLARRDVPILRLVADALRDLAHPGWRELPKKEQDEVRPLDVYALRGGMYRETAWVRSPLQPTVIASTVDQVGSRLLFRGYGVSDSMKPVHAALVGNDALILLDEAHCAKPFQQTAEAVERYRGWNDSPAPFRFVSITATPTVELVEAEKKRKQADPIVLLQDLKEDRDHALLGKRIEAPKPAKLVAGRQTAKKRADTELLDLLEEHARELAKTAACVGIIVNRVKTARDLKAALGEDAVLLTGRMRPLDRDRLFRERLQPLLSGADGTPPKFVIGTQCLEVGADFDFHALVTECASLDALRQRFGRLNRIAARPTADAVIVVRGDQTGDTSDDPIYGASLGATWKWLRGDGDPPRDTFDFGIAAMRAALDGVDLTPLNAASPDAPVLFPAHLDCWVQTHPIPTPDPEVALWLHGPKEGGQPDVQVVFRDDLPANNTSLWPEIVGLCPPSSSEAVAVPIGVFKKWLAGETRDTDTTGDVEGVAADDAEDLEPSGRSALCWKGAENDETKVISDPDDVRPTRTYVVPCTADANLLGDLATENRDTPPRDYAEEAFQRSRDKALLRLKGFDLSEDDEEFEEKLTAKVQEVIAECHADWPERACADLTTKSRRIATKYPDGKGWVVVGRRRLMQFDPEFLDDTASSYSPGRREVTLNDHSRGVAAFAARFAGGCGLDEALFTQAGFLHDLGKLDPRFQRMLGSYQRDNPLAKSRRAPRTPREREEARLVHRYPKGARHELLSAALLADRADDLLHLIATHHGSARPFADAVEDADEVKVSAVTLFDQRWACDDARQRIADWNPELAERFWRQVRKYGWWGSAYREAVFRLADHAQSRAEQEGDEAAEAKAEDVSPPPLVPRPEPQRLHPLPLPGLDGSNPLAFLAALGALKAISRRDRAARLSWQRDPYWHPVLHWSVGSSDDVIAGITEELGRLAGHPALTLGDLNADNLVASATEFRHACLAAAAAASPTDQTSADYLTTFASEVVLNENVPDQVADTAFRTMAGAGHQHFLRFMRNVVAATQLRHVEKAILRAWTYDDPLTNFSLRWDPVDDVRYALRWKNPGEESALRKRTGSELGATRLAIEGLPLFPSVPANGGLATTGFQRKRGGDVEWTWPLWGTPAGLDTVRSLLASRHLLRDEPPTAVLRSFGVVAAFRTRRITQGKFRNFTPARPV